MLRALFLVCVPLGKSFFISFFLPSFFFLCFFQKERKKKRRRCTLSVAPKAAYRAVCRGSARGDYRACGAETAGRRGRWLTLHGRHSARTVGRIWTVGGHERWGEPEPRSSFSALPSVPQRSGRTVQGGGTTTQPGSPCGARARPNGERERRRQRPLPVFAAPATGFQRWGEHDAALARMDAIRRSGWGEYDGGATHMLVFNH